MNVADFLQTEDSKMYTQNIFVMQTKAANESFFYFYDFATPTGVTLKEKKGIYIKGIAPIKHIIISI